MGHFRGFFCDFWSLHIRDISDFRYFYDFYGFHGFSRIRYFCIFTIYWGFHVFVVSTLFFVFRDFCGWYIFLVLAILRHYFSSFSDSSYFAIFAFLCVFRSLADLAKKNRQKESSIFFNFTNFFPTKNFNIKYRLCMQSF